jgi:3-deoxy-manno-octulosonate cytidylyltransferase (CMP-KDO synthetase)
MDLRCPVVRVSYRLFAWYSDNDSSGSVWKVNFDGAIAIIPARYQSTRLPGKPILEIQGKTLIEHVYRRVQQAALVKRILVATDDDRIAKAVRAFGGDAVMTRTDHQSGTDRLAEASEGLAPGALVVNVQGDEPLIEPEVIDRAVATAQEGDYDMVTLSTRFDEFDRASIEDPNRVKVVVDLQGFALYFSRLPIPSAGTSFLHLGLYVYRADFLRRFTRLERTPLEIAERLEQLRALEHGYRIRVVEVESASWGIDTPADLEKFQSVLAKTEGEHQWTRNISS